MWPDTAIGAFSHQEEPPLSPVLVPTLRQAGDLGVWGGGWRRLWGWLDGDLWWGGMGPQPRCYAETRWHRYVSWLLTSLSICRSLGDQSQQRLMACPGTVFNVVLFGYRHTARSPREYFRYISCQVVICNLFSSSGTWGWLGSSTAAQFMARMRWWVWTGQACRPSGWLWRACSLIPRTPMRTAGYSMTLLNSDAVCYVAQSVRVWVPFLDFFTDHNLFKRRGTSRKVLRIFGE